jgi:hypothetical protein
MGDHLDQTLKMLVPRNEISLGIDLDHDSAFFAALANPFLRSQSTAASISPLVSTSAFLQSIIPAPVFSRSSFTNCELMFVMFANPLSTDAHLPLTTPYRRGPVVPCRTTAAAIRP